MAVKKKQKAVYRFSFGPWNRITSYNVCYTKLLRQVASIDKLSVVLVAFFAVLILGERPTPLAWLGIALVGAGALILSIAATR